VRGIRGVKQLRVGFAAGKSAFFGSKFEGFLPIELGLTDELVHTVGEGLRGVAVGGCLAGECGSDKQGDFTAGGFFVERRGEIGEIAAAELFVELGDFAGEAGGAVAEDCEGVGDSFSDAVRGFVEDEGAILEAQALEGAMTFAGTRREETDEEKLFVGQAGS